MHRDHRRRGQTVAEIAEVIGGHDIEAADHGAPGFVILDARYAQPRGRIDDAEIDPELIETIVQHPRHHRGGAVAGVRGWRPPIAFHRDAAARRRSAIDSDSASGMRRMCLSSPSAALSPAALRTFSAKTGPYSIQMAVGVDDRMGEPGTDLLGVPLFACAHALSSADVLGALCCHS